MESGETTLKPIGPLVECPGSRLLFIPRGMNISEAIKVIISSQQTQTEKGGEREEKPTS